MSNTIDASLTKQFVGDIERLQSEMDSRKGEYMNWCQKQRELISEYYDRAKDSGIPKKALKAVVKTRQLERRIEGLKEDLVEEDLDDTYDQIMDALGGFADTPLGGAAAEKAAEKAAAKEAKKDAKKKEGKDALNSLVDGPGDDDAASQQVADNVTRLQTGITQLQQK